MNSWSSGSWKTSPTRRRMSRSVLRDSAVPPISTVPVRSGQHAVEVQHQCGLARTVGAEHRDALARCDVEIDAGEGDVPVRVGIAQVSDAYRRRSHRSTHANCRHHHRSRRRAASPPPTASTKPALCTRPRPPAAGPVRRNPGRASPGRPAHLARTSARNSAPTPFAIAPTWCSIRGESPREIRAIRIRRASAASTSM